ncbi:MAG: hypothetical protein ACPGVU_11280, partial [Limisphaerales bacterium]
INAPKQSSYAAVTAKLDRGGDLFGYLGTAQWLKGLSGKIREFEKLALDMSPDEEEEIQLAFKVVTGLVKRSGMEELSGVGISSVKVGEAQYRSRFIMHHDAASEKGYLWNMFGEKPHALTGLDVIPQDAVFASYGDVNVKNLWQTLLNEIVLLGTPEIRESLSAAPEQFKMMTGMDLDAFLDSFGGELGAALLLNDAIPFTVPLPMPTANGQPLTIPQPELLLLAKANDRLIFDRLVQLTEKMEGVRKEVDGNIHKVLFPPPVPFIPALQPAIAYDGEHLFIVSTPLVLKKVLAAKAGGPSLRDNEQFKALAAHLPSDGNSFTFLSDRIGKEYNKLQQNMIPAAGGGPTPEQFTSLIQKLSTPAYTASVFQNTDEGWLTTSVGNQSMADAMSLGTIAVVAILAGMLLPALAKAKSKASRIKCVNNMKQISLALKIYASDNEDRYPFQIPEAQGGTKEKTAQDNRGDDRNPFIHLMKLKLELGSPRILTCPAHEGVKPATSWDAFTPDHISYKFRSGKDVDETNLDQVMLWCPHDHNVGLVDGAVMQMDESDTDARTAGSWTF